MTDLLTVTFVSSLIYGAVTAGVPLLLGGLGEQISEKAGVLNIGLEGMMLLGAYGAFVATYTTGSIFIGLIFGALAGLITALLMAVLCIWIRLNQIVVGIAITLGAEGITALLHHFQFSRSYPRLDKADTLSLGSLSDLPIVGVALFNHHTLVYVAFLLVPFMAWLYRHTHIGLNLQAAGDRPAALDAAGVSVMITRTAAVLVTGLLSGLGGAYLAVVSSGLFLPFMTGGIGFIGIVMAMLARGKPLWVMLGALLFGASLSLTTALQIAGFNIPTDIIQMLPYAMVILVLIIFARNSHLPPSLGMPYHRGER